MKFTEAELAQIDEWLQSGWKPERIAEHLGMAAATFRYRLARSGREMKTYRRLEITSAAEEPREMAAGELTPA